MPRKAQLSASIIAVEDDPHQMELLGMSIQELPVDIPVICAVDGMLAMQAIQSIDAEHFGKHVAMVLLDLRLPKMHGLEVLSRARELGLTEKAPFLVFTSSDNSAERDRALELGARDYLVKPLGYRPLQALVLTLYERWISQRLKG